VPILLREQGFREQQVASPRADPGPETGNQCGLIADHHGRSRHHPLGQGPVARDRDQGGTRQEGELRACDCGGGSGWDVVLEVMMTRIAMRKKKRKRRVGHQQGGAMTVSRGARDRHHMVLLPLILANPNPTAIWRTPGRAAGAAMLLQGLVLLGYMTSWVVLLVASQLR